MGCRQTVSDGLGIGTVIRRARVDDINGMCDAHRRSIREIASKDYSPTQINAWAGFILDEELRSVIRYQIEHDFRWVLEIDGRIEGFCYLIRPVEEVCRLEALYLTPVAAGRGLARRVMGLAEEQAKSLGAERMDLISSVTARGFYEKLGFVVLSTSESRKIRGCLFQTYRMEKALINRDPKFCPGQGARP